MNAEQEAQEYVKDLQQQIAEMNDIEKLISETILVLAKSILVILNRHDIEALSVLKDGVSNLFEQAESILKHGPKHLQ
ncbi:MAG: hypothetical protein R6W88_08860 [Desulfobacterales bacterium]